MSTPEDVERLSTRFAEAYGKLLKANDGADWDKLVTEYAEMPVSLLLLDVLICRFLGESNERNRQRNAKIEALEAKVAELEQREYQGVWSDTRAYAKGASVTRQGSVWHSNVAENRSKPGEHPTAWTLKCKRGADGRDGKDAR